MAEQEGVFIVPMLFTIDGKEYLEGVSLKSRDFFMYQEEGRDIKSAQPTVGSVLELWDSLLKEYDEVVHIPMTKALSGSYDTSLALSREYGGRVYVVDNQRISVTQKPVSYTHLDVYKRQSIRCSEMWRFLLTHRNWAGNFPKNLRRDVYKRQMEDRAMAAGLYSGFSAGRFHRFCDDGSDSVGSVQAGSFPGRRKEPV